MAEEKVSRRLAAILAADIAGYSRLMGEDEPATVRALKGHQALVLPLVGEYGGRVIDTAGDGILAEFPSVVSAVECAVKIQGTMAVNNQDVPENRRMRYRIGINLGDVIHDERRIYGDGINIAARLETIAEPGGICISSKVYDEVVDKVALHFRELGEVQLKNIARPVRIYALASGGSDASASTTRAEAKSIAVLPFANMSDNKESSLFFADGIHEDIRTNLALIRELRVVSRTSVMQYRETTKPIRQIGQELGVAYLLEGSVRRAGTMVRVTCQLINAQTDEHVWAKTYDRDLTDIFAIQAALAHDIAGLLQAALSPQEKSFLERRGTENVAAYDLFLRARDSSNHDHAAGSLQSLKTQEDFLENAVELDANFAAAWGDLSVVHARLGFLGFDASEARLAKAKAASETSIRLAHDSPEVIRALGSYYFYGLRDYAQATTQYEKLARLQPNDPTVHFLIGTVQRRQGRWAESLASLRRAAQLDPGNVLFARVLRVTFIMGHRFEEGMAEHRRLVTVLPEGTEGAGSIEDAAWLAMFALWASGSTKEAEDWLARLPAEQFDSPRTRDWRKFWAENLGNTDEFCHLDRLQPVCEDAVFSRNRFVQALAAATIHAASGDEASARTRLAGYPEELQSRLVQESANARLWAELGMMEAVLGHKDEALHSAHRAVELLPEARDAVNGPALSVALAFVHAWTGDKDRAITELTRLLRVPSWVVPTGPPINVHAMRLSAWFAPLRGDPRYEALLNDPANNAPLF